MFSPTSEALPPSDPTAREGHAFLAALSSTQEGLELRIKEAEGDLGDAAIPEEVKGHIMAAIGKARLLITQKFVQFRELCRLNIEQRAHDSFQASGSDLAGYWDMMMIQVNEVQASFGELAILKAKNWQEPERTDAMRLPLPTPRKKAGLQSAQKASPCMSSERAEQAAKARAEARKKFMQAKRQLVTQSAEASRDEDVVFFVPPEKNN